MHRDPALPPQSPGIDQRTDLAADAVDEFGGGRPQVGVQHPGRHTPRSLYQSESRSGDGEGHPDRRRHESAQRPHHFALDVGRAARRRAGASDRVADPEAGPPPSAPGVDFDRDPRFPPAAPLPEPARVPAADSAFAVEADFPRARDDDSAREAGDDFPRDDDSPRVADGREADPPSVVDDCARGREADPLPVVGGCVRERGAGSLPVVDDCVRGREADPLPVVGGCVRGCEADRLPVVDDWARGREVVSPSVVEEEWVGDSASAGDVASEGCGCCWVLARRSR
ncbi:hypothetical protein NWFMUON74_25590 [Nocardia wallacei]|uniref:Uncharacterized protein n=1 Tax=Nocardia wallacei TaxID=480035 RepID=A0A7G1KHS8_9NOCA|nr:hypothetical protein NWFMUON74_25590 [Nocardia wallacei]